MQAGGSTFVETFAGAAIARVKTSEKLSLQLRMGRSRADPIVQKWGYVGNQLAQCFGIILTHWAEQSRWSQRAT